MITLLIVPADLRALQGTDPPSAQRDWSTNDTRVLKLTCERQGHADEPMWSQMFPGAACKVVGYGITVMRLTCTDGGHREEEVFWEEQVCFVMLLAEYMRPFWANSTNEFRELLACYVCAVLCLERSGAAVADSGHEHRAVPKDCEGLLVPVMYASC